ncbi:MAG: type II and III secretion system protein family protein [Hyphomicrobiaceae bacterium]
MVIASLLLILSAGQGSAQQRGPQQQPAAQPLVSGDGMHRSLLRIAPTGPFPVQRRVAVGVDKSMLIELPVDVENVLVSNPEVVDLVVQSSRQVYLLAKDQGEANAFFIGANGQKILLLEVSVTRDLGSMLDAMHRLLPGAKIRAEAVGDNIVLSGSVVNAVDANRAAELANRILKKKDGVINMITVAVPAKEQVLLKVTVAEMQRDAIRRLGVDIVDSFLKAGNITFTKVLTNTFPVTSSIVPFGTAGSATFPQWRSGPQHVTTLINSLERAGLMRTLAEPNLTALSGETAKFLAGGEFPVPIAQQDRTVTIQFKSFGVSTAFKPIVLSDGRISLAVSAEVSELSSEGSLTVSDIITVPALRVRRAETTLEMPSGATLAMAGLLSDDTRQSVEGVPGLKSVPILGQLFRSNDYRRKETELVILVTPYLATHMAAEQVGRPDQGFAPPSDLRSIFMGHINRIYGKPGHEPHGRYEGEHGFIVEYPDPGVKG